MGSDSSWAFWLDCHFPNNLFEMRCHLLRLEFLVPHLYIFHEKLLGFIADCFLFLYQFAVWLFINFEEYLLNLSITFNGVKAIEIFCIFWINLKKWMCCHLTHNWLMIDDWLNFIFIHIYWYQCILEFRLAWLLAAFALFYDW